MAVSFEHNLHCILNNLKEIHINLCKKENLSIYIKSQDIKLLKLIRRYLIPDLSDVYLFLSRLTSTVHHAKHM